MKELLLMGGALQYEELGSVLHGRTAAPGEARMGTAADSVEIDVSLSGLLVCLGSSSQLADGVRDTEPLLAPRYCAVAMRVGATTFALPPPSCGTRRGAAPANGGGVSGRRSVCLLGDGLKVAHADR
mmetsp:Transcript_95708/g.270895  ORF Transcript_95708/g.270895 Transcript_95708/m.270895 type:complete len:127 (-) Transcript_95708:1390-1770(-)